MLTLVKTLLEVGIDDEDLIVSKLNITHLEYRQVLTKSDGLTKGAVAEILEKKFDVSAPRLARMYKVPADDIQAIRYRNITRTTPFTDMK